ncbi:hypothetical protein CDAR_316621 [Caerostris darwini]|uniref:Uncharacterized protein n=1 Tax=Caerostris darwini TaxID=1538125 RepID=A0AAV4UJ98_9ARAC|nr:hypothetical protein CDAR_316621 [Caerostris darwini]
MVKSDCGWVGTVWVPVIDRFRVGSLIAFVRWSVPLFFCRRWGELLDSTLQKKNYRYYFPAHPQGEKKLPHPHAHDLICKDPFHQDGSGRIHNSQREVKDYQTCNYHPDYLL